MLGFSIRYLFFFFFVRILSGIFICFQVNIFRVFSIRNHFVELYTI
ncbi:hypothetical protein DCAR_0728136 [Daucus carota subsp. sativus]|uniref:Uncharacterized protein n=1 Tax=Daucus carota subsp. sativus TaxID=79200 RepID=A0AAF1B9Y1_DAUCS|nr:hypothetical protein DCAR_0728136 [Daucus carota subsp. sativus]